MFQFPGFPPHEVCVPRWGDRASAAGFAHSETPGSKAVCASPGTIAACRVLRRLPAPRHPPCARDTFPRPSRGAGATVIPCMNSLAHDVNLIRTYRRPPRGRPIRCYSSHDIGDIYLFIVCRSHRWRISSSIVPGVPARGVHRAMRLSRYAGRTPGTGYRGAARADRRGGRPGLRAPGSVKEKRIQVIRLS